MDVGRRAEAMWGECQKSGSMGVIESMDIQRNRTPGWLSWLARGGESQETQCGCKFQQSEAKGASIEWSTEECDPLPGLCITVDTD